VRALSAAIRTFSQDQHRRARTTACRIPASPGFPSAQPEPDPHSDSSNIRRHHQNRPGGAQARFLAEVGEAEQQRNLATLLTEYHNYRNNIMPSGPGARELIGPEARWHPDATRRQ
jgi:hypothetical protein